MRDCVRGCGSVECAIVYVVVGVWNARLCAWLWECGMRDCVRGCGSSKCKYGYTDDGVLIHTDA